MRRADRRSRLSTASRPRSMARRLSEMAADGAITSGSPLASVTRTLPSSNCTRPLSFRRSATVSMRTPVPANSSAMPLSKVCVRKSRTIGPCSSRTYRRPTATTAAKTAAPSILANNASARLRVRARALPRAPAGDVRLAAAPAVLLPPPVLVTERRSPFPLLVCCSDAAAAIANAPKATPAAGPETQHLARTAGKSGNQN